MNNPNIIFIVLDTLRADRINYIYQNNNLTPFINELLQDAIYFKNCIANSPWTLPVHKSMFSGLYPSQIKKITGNIYSINNKIPTIAEILNNNGYMTLCYTENPFISKKYGLTKGFKHLTENWKNPKPWIEESEDLLKFMKYIYKMNKLIRNKIRSEKFLSFWDFFYSKIKKLISRIIKLIFWKSILFKKSETFKDLKHFFEIIYSKKSEPLFLFFNIMAPHSPYIPAIESMKKFNVTFNDFSKLKFFLLNSQKNKINIEKKRVSKKKVKIIKKLYNACVHYADLIVEKIFFYLKMYDLLDNSYILITSDHGEHLCGESDHNLWDHYTHISVYDTLIKVPLILYNKSYQKTLIKDQVELKDIFHTIIDLSNIDCDILNNFNRNKSIIYQFKNKMYPKFIFGEYLKVKEKMIKIMNQYKTDRELVPRIINDICFIRSNKYKLIKYGVNEKELFNLEEDTFELKNIIGVSNQKYEELNKRLEIFTTKAQNVSYLQESITKKEKDSIDSTIKGISFKKL